MFGKPKQGTHAARFLGSAAVDYFGTLIMAFFLTFATGVPLVLSTLGFFSLGLLGHIVFGVKTQSTTWLGFKC